MADMLASLIDLATLLGKTEDDPLDNSSGTLALEVGTAVVQAATGQRILLVEDDEEQVWGGVGSELRLSQHPIVSVASVSYAGSALSLGTASGTWRRSRYGIWRDLGWTEVYGEPSPIDVVYTHGLPPGHQGLQLGRSVSLSLARGLITNPDGTIREQIDDYAVAYDQAATTLDAAPSLKALLRKQYGPKARMVSAL